MTTRQPGTARGTPDYEHLTVRELIDATGLGIRVEEFVEQLEVVVGSRRYVARSVRPPEPTQEFDRATRAALERIGADFSPFPQDRAHPADLTRVTFVSLLADSDTPEVVARHLKRDVSRVRQRIRDQTLWAINGVDGTRLPRIQFEEDGSEIQGMDDVLKALLAGLHPVGVFRFLTTPMADLELDGADPISPREWLRSGGDAETVAAIARDLHVA